MDNHKPNNSGEIVVGLDIGTTKIACFIGQKNEFGKIELWAMVEVIRSA